MGSAGRRFGGLPWGGGRLGWAEGEAEARGVCDRASAGPAGARGLGWPLQSSHLKVWGLGTIQAPGVGRARALDAGIPPASSHVGSPSPGNGSPGPAGSTWVVTTAPLIAETDGRRGFV